MTIIHTRSIFQIEKIKKDDFKIFESEGQLKKAIDAHIEQENCPYCHGKKDNHHLPKSFECNHEDAMASIELDENIISFDNSDGHFMYGEFKINYRTTDKGI